MKRHTGIVLDTNFLIPINVERDQNGSILSGMAINDTTYQNQAILLNAQPGEVKEFPTVGVGIGDIINDYDFEQWKRTVTEQFEGDGMRIKKLIINENGMSIDAEYK